MKTICKQCKSEIPELRFSEDQRLEIWGLVIQNFKLFAIEKIRDEFQLSLEDAKVIIAHLNKDFGKCHNCNYDGLDEENIECPKCKSFNYNLKIETSFNKEFCSHLEFSLDFDRLGDDRVKGFWCDGVDFIPKDIDNLSKSNLKENKKIKTRTWTGKSGQEVYDMTINFGEKAVENYLKNESLIDCIPKGDYEKWIKIDPEKKEIEVTLK